MSTAAPATSETPAEAVVPTLFEQSRTGRRAARLPEPDVPAREEGWIPESMRRSERPGLPEVSELQVVRHFTRLSRLNFSIDGEFYPLGSCTMKYNPRIDETVAATPGFPGLHPEQPAETVQGLLEVLWELREMLSELCGLPGVSLQPAAGAHGELTALFVIQARLRARGETDRHRILIPDSAHGTNPASVRMAGFEAEEIPSDERGFVDLEALEATVGPDVAGLMITNPNTLGLFDLGIERIAELVHEAGGYVYLDGANMNALVGRVRPADFGVDVMHLNLHKTFSTPHGGGGPGAGPVLCTGELAPHLPVPRVDRADDGTYRLVREDPASIGRIKGSCGNVGVLVRAWAYIRSHTLQDLRDISGMAVLNASYLLEKLRPLFDLPYGDRCMHECVFSARNVKDETGVRTLHIAKRLLDKGFHAPTVYFPLIVKEALMIEPTETETRETLDAFVAALEEIVEEARDDPDLVKGAPHDLPLRRLDEVKAARHPCLCATAR